MPLHTVEPLRLYRQIAGQIAALIDDGEFPAGSRLPPERALAQLLGVSRTSVREAIIALEIAGRVGDTPYLRFGDVPAVVLAGVLAALALRLGRRSGARIASAGG